MRSGRRIVPYASVLYDLTGKTWVYDQRRSVDLLRGAVEIDTIKGNNVYLSDGPPARHESTCRRSAAKYVRDRAEGRSLTARRDCFSMTVSARVGDAFR